MKVAKLLALALSLLLLFPQVAQAQSPTVQMHHLMLHLTEKGSLQVQEQLVVENPKGALDSPVTLSLPKGYQNLELQEGLAQGVVEGDKILVKELPQGETVFKFKYELYLGAAPHFILTKELTLPTRAFFVLAEQGALAVNSNQLVNAGPMTMGQKQWQIYQLAQDQKIPGEIQMTIQPLEGKTDAATGSAAGTGAWERFVNQLPFKGVTAFLFLLLAVVLPLLALGRLWRQRQNRDRIPLPDDGEDAFRSLLAQEKALKAMLLELEQDYAAGKLNQEEYQLTLDVLKKKLLDVRTQLKTFTD